jgi:hypothetical protein
MMEVFGEEYDLDNCTEEQKKEVEEWYDKNKNEDVPPVKEELENGHYETEEKRPKLNKLSSADDITEALASLNGNTDFTVSFIGNPKHIELYKMVHPLGGNVSVDDAAAKMGVSRVTAYRWLNRLVGRNPSADFFRWPTKRQLDVYRLIHPDLGGLTYREAARALNSTYQHIVDMMCRMRETHPQCFSFERVPSPKVVRFNPAVHDDKVKESF